MARTKRSEPRIRHGSLSEDSYRSSGQAFEADLQQSHIDSSAGARNLALPEEKRLSCPLHELPSSMIISSFVSG